MVVVFEFVLAVLVPCGAVHHRREKDQDYDLLYCTMSTYDNINVHEIRLVFACGTAVISIPQILCLRIC